MNQYKQKEREFNMEILSEKIKFIHKGLELNLNLETPLAVKLINDTQKTLLHLLLSQLKDCMLGENAVALHVSHLEALYRTANREEIYRNTEADCVQLFDLQYWYRDDVSGIYVDLRVFDVMKLDKLEGELSFLFSDRFARQVERRI